MGPRQKKVTERKVERDFTSLSCLNLIVEMVTEYLDSHSFTHSHTINWITEMLSKEECIFQRQLHKSFLYLALS